MTKTDDISRRRFGPAFERKCARPETIECARWPCQMRNRCRYDASDRQVYSTPDVVEGF